MSAIAGVPRRVAFLRAEWRYLVMLNYDVDPALLAPLAPAGTVLDLYHGRAIASIVAFRFLRTRLLGVPVPLHRDFDEVNLRFYVRRELPGGEVRRAATFVRELVPRRAIAVVARLGYNEPYRAVPMRSEAPAGLTDAPGRLAYEWRTGGAWAGRWQRAAASAVGAPVVPPMGSETAFVAEHYWGYTRQRDGGTVEYQVEHPPWRTWAVERPELDADVRGLYGAAWEPVLAGAPTSAFVAEGSAVAVYPPRRVVAAG
ncbi:MAG TPA: DUF2071 domain-containing protein [Gemmatirosa sp.]